MIPTSRHARPGLAAAANIGAHLIVLAASLIAIGASGIALHAALAPFMI